MKVTWLLAMQIMYEKCADVEIFYEETQKYVRRCKSVVFFVFVNKILLLESVT